MTRLASEHGAINLAQGFPKLPRPRPPERRRGAGDSRRREPVCHHLGAKRLRDALARKYADWYGMTVNPETEITVTCGATEAMASALLAIVDPGDEVIVFEPFYENYGPDAILCGAKPVYVRSRRPRSSTSTGWQPRSRRAPARSSSAPRTTDGPGAVAARARSDRELCGGTTPTR